MTQAAAPWRLLEGGCACGGARYRVEAPPLFVHCCRGQRVTRCPTCLVALWSSYAGAGPAILFLRAGTLDRAGEIEPDIHIYTSTRLPWVEIPKGVPSMLGFYDAKAVWPVAAQARYRAARGAATTAP